MKNDFKVSVLASGSRGNCTLIMTNKTAILLDAGISGKKILAALSAIGVDKINGLLISHEHTDHIKNAGVICRKLDIPIYITKATYEITKGITKKMKSGVIHFSRNRQFNIGDIRIMPFESYHDAIDGCNFTFTNEKSTKKLGFITDTGTFTNESIKNMLNCSTIIMESNHDVNMLLNGPYQWHIKQRIRSKYGHLSNKQAKRFISKIINPKLKTIILIHLSETNNIDTIAYKNIDDYIKTLGMNINLIVSSQKQRTELIDC